MGKKRVLFCIIAVLSFLAAAASGNVLEVGDRAVVSGDYVRVRSGPTLEHRILDKVNSGTEVTVLSRGDKPQKIGDSTSYWYQVKLDTGGLSGWIYGAFLKKRALDTTQPGARKAEFPPLGPLSSAPNATMGARPGAQRVSLKEIGVIDEGGGPIASGDLDRNGKPELLFIGTDRSGRYSSLNGYEKSPSGFDRVYSIDMRETRVGRVEVLSTGVLDRSFLAAYGAGGRASSGRSASNPHGGLRASSGGFSRESYASLYYYDPGRGAPRLALRLNTPALALGTPDGRSPFLVYLKRNRAPDGDGTVSSIVEIAKIETRGANVVLRERLQYAKPLPVKKLTLFDLDRDGRDEIVAEIGGGDMGGGIVILALRDGAIVRLANSGVPTLNNAPFISMWGAYVGGKPQLVVYSSDPSGTAPGTSEFGFILASLSEGVLKVERFCPVNKMLDEVNNGRRVVHFAEGGKNPEGRGFPFLVIDAEGESKRSSVKKASL